MTRAGCAFKFSSFEQGSYWSGKYHYSLSLMNLKKRFIAISVNFTYIIIISNRGKYCCRSEVIQPSYQNYCKWKCIHHSGGEKRHLWHWQAKMPSSHWKRNFH